MPIVSSLAAVQQSFWGSCSWPWFLAHNDGVDLRRFHSAQFSSGLGSDGFERSTSNLLFDRCAKREPLIFAIIGYANIRPVASHLHV